MNVKYRTKALVAAFLVALLLGSLAPAFGAGVVGPESIVNATATTEIVSVSLNSTSINYGQVTAGATSVVKTVTVTNNGTVAENFECAGDDATSGLGTWVLAATIGTDQYKHEWSTAVITWTALSSTAYAQFAAAKAVTTSEVLSLRLTAPSVSSVLGQYTAPVYIRAVSS